MALKLHKRQDVRSRAAHSTRMALSCPSHPTPTASGSPDPEGAQGKGSSGSDGEDTAHQVCRKDPGTCMSAFTGRCVPIPAQGSMETALTPPASLPHPHGMKWSIGVGHLLCPQCSETTGRGKQGEVLLSILFLCGLQKAGQSTSIWLLVLDYIKDLGLETWFEGGSCRPQSSGGSSDCLKGWGGGDAPCKDLGNLVCV